MFFALCDVTKGVTMDGIRALGPNPNQSFVTPFVTLESVRSVHMGMDHSTLCGLARGVTKDFLGYGPK